MSNFQNVYLKFANFFHEKILIFFQKFYHFIFQTPGQKEYLQSEDDRAKLDGLYECILCACCQSNCPSYWWQPGDYYGPAVLMASYRWIIDSRDEYTDERLEKLSGQKLERCYQIGACSLTCPKGLDPRAAIEKLKSMYGDYKKMKRQNLAI